MPARITEKEFTCVVCGRKFFSTATHEPKYCSQLCRSRAAAQRNKRADREKKAAQEKWGHDPNEYAKKQREKTLEMIPKIITEEPKVEEPKKETPKPAAKWITITVCSECGYQNEIGATRFCPDCGAQMEVEI